jgi:hypothetical protein
MKRFMLLALCCLALTGCANSLIKKLPHATFDEFSYHRGGNVTSATITARNGEFKDGVFTVEDMSITEDWGPAFNADIKIKGYKRTLPADQ